MMSVPEGNMRALPYPLDYAESLSSETPYSEDTVFLSLENWPVESSTERVRIVLDVSLEEYVALASVIDVGRDIAYGTESEYIWWLWTRILASMTICNDVADCITNSAAVRAALAAWYGEQDQAAAAAAMDAIKDDDLLGDVGCDPDVIWSAVLSLVQRLNRINEDGLEVFEANTNFGDFLSSVVGSITVIDESSIDALLEWVSFLQENIAENYVAQYTLAYEEEVACDLFCIALENCSITPEQIFDYFAGRVGSALTWESLLNNIFGYLIGRAWSGTEIADFMMLSQVGFRRLFGYFVGQRAFSDVSMALRVGANSPDNDWSIVCDACPETWIQVFDFEISDGGWTAQLGPSSEAYATYVNGVGWQTTDTASANGRRVGIVIDVEAGSYTSAQMEFEYTRGTINCALYPATARLEIIGEGIPFLNVDCENTPESPLSDPDDQTLAAGTMLAFLRASGNVPPNYSGSAVIKKITMTGTGTNPFL